MLVRFYSQRLRSTGLLKVQKQTPQPPRGMDIQIWTSRKRRTRARQGGCQKRPEAVNAGITVTHRSTPLLGAHESGARSPVLCCSACSARTGPSNTGRTWPRLFYFFCRASVYPSNQVARKAADGRVLGQLRHLLTAVRCFWHQLASFLPSLPPFSVDGLPLLAHPCRPHMPRPLYSHVQEPWRVLRQERAASHTA